MLYDVCSQKDEDSTVIVHNVNGMEEEKALELKARIERQTPGRKIVWIRESEV
jgi:hypothetical protein